MYKTTNVKNNKFYIGVHETTNIDDDYLGSGKKFKNSLYYHGRESFKREILEYFDNSEEMYNREQEVVNEELLKNPKCLNISIGGKGGWSRQQRSNGAIGMNKILWNNPEWVKEKKKQLSVDIKKRHSLGLQKSIQENYSWNGKSHSDETKKKMSESRKGKGTGTKNSQYGTCWITNGTINKKIYKDDEIPEGFKLGRNITK